MRQSGLDASPVCSARRAPPALLALMAAALLGAACSKTDRDTAEDTAGAAATRGVRVSPEAHAPLMGLMGDLRDSIPAASRD